MWPDSYLRSFFSYLSKVPAGHGYASAYLFGNKTIQELIGLHRDKVDLPPKIAPSLDHLGLTRKLIQPKLEFFGLLSCSYIYQ
jgi:hypothetical protein